MEIYHELNTTQVTIRFKRFFEGYSLPSLSKDINMGFFSPRVDITDKDDHYEIVADLPGVDKKNLSVNLEDGVLTIEASTSEEKTEKKKGKVIRKERHSGTFMRSFSLGTDIKESDIKANFKDGVLTIEAPKSKTSTSGSKKIKIQ